MQQEHGKPLYRKYIISAGIVTCPSQGQERPFLGMDGPQNATLNNRD